MGLQNYRDFIEMTSNMIYIVALGVDFKCPRKINLNTQCPPTVFRSYNGPCPAVKLSCSTNPKPSLVSDGFAHTKVRLCGPACYERRVWKSTFLNFFVEELNLYFANHDVKTQH